MRFIHSFVSTLKSPKKKKLRAGGGQKHRNEISFRKEKQAQVILIEKCEIFNSHQSAKSPCIKHLSIYSCACSSFFFG